MAKRPKRVQSLEPVTGGGVRRTVARSSSSRSSASQSAPPRQKFCKLTWHSGRRSVVSTRGADRDRDQSRERQTGAWCACERVCEGQRVERCAESAETRLARERGVGGSEEQRAWGERHSRAEQGKLGSGGAHRQTARPKPAVELQRGLQESFECCSPIADQRRVILVLGHCIGGQRHRQRAADRVSRHTNPSHTRCRWQLPMRYGFDRNGCSDESGGCSQLDSVGS